MINREAIEKYLNGRFDAAIAPAPEAKNRAFLQAAIDLFCEKFEAEGWPSEMPGFTVIPPSSLKSDDPLGQDGYAGYVAGNVGYLWRWPHGANGWADPDPEPAPVA